VAGNGALIADCGANLATVRVASPGTGAFSAPQRLPGRHFPTVVAAADEQHILAMDVGENPNTPDQFRATFYRTANGGRSWQRAETLTVSNSGDAATGTLRFASSTFGSFVGAGGQSYYVTTDGGATWQSHTFAG
jgi:photosystem II stability/assembly factor-like uncharacterized protein